MKPVKNGNRAKSGKIGRGVSAVLENRAKSGEDQNPKKVPCFSAVVNKTTTNENETVPEIPGVDQLDAAPAGSRIYVADFFSDEIALLTKRATRVLDRTAIFIAPRVGWPKSIYWKSEVSK